MNVIITGDDNWQFYVDYSKLDRITQFEDPINDRQNFTYIFDADYAEYCDIKKHAKQYYDMEVPEAVVDITMISYSRTKVVILGNIKSETLVND